jgi:hypothetical protein
VLSKQSAPKAIVIHCSTQVHIINSSFAINYFGDNTMTHIKRTMGLAASIALVFPLFASAAADQEAAMKDANNWLHPRGQHDNQGYSKLAQINKKNVKNVKMAWSFATGVNRGHEGSPVVVGNMMYLHTAFPNNVYALDLNDNQKNRLVIFPKTRSISTSCFVL